MSRLKPEVIRPNGPRVLTDQDVRLILAKNRLQASRRRERSAFVRMVLTLAFLLAWFSAGLWWLS